MVSIKLIIEDSVFLGFRIDLTWRMAFRKISVPIIVLSRFDHRLRQLLRLFLLEMVGERGRSGGSSLPWLVVFR